MTTMWAAAAGVLLSCGVALAAEPGGLNNGIPAAGETAIGVGLICDTSEQAERFIALRADGREPEQAMATVNAEAKAPRACGVAAVAFIPDQTTEMKTIGGRLVRIMRINVIAGFNGSAWLPVEGMVQYAVIEAAGETI